MGSKPPSLKTRFVANIVFHEELEKRAGRNWGPTVLICVLKFRPPGLDPAFLIRGFLIRGGGVLQWVGGLSIMKGGPTDPVAGDFHCFFYDFS